MRRYALLLLAWSGLLIAAGPDLDTLRREAEAGDGYAQLNLGAAYDNGLGVERDLAQAMAWYRRAAEQGIAEAQFNLGHLLVSRGDPAGGARWMGAAARQGMANAQYLLGVMYFEGLGLGRDPEAARAWLKKAADQGHREAAAHPALAVR